MPRVPARPVRIALAAALLALVVAWVVLLRPQLLGGSAAYVVVSGTSMEPTLSDGDFVLARKRSSYRVGDVVAFSRPEGRPGRRRDGHPSNRGRVGGERLPHEGRQPGGAGHVAPEAP
jgi:signal peptidase I